MISTVSEQQHRIAAAAGTPAKRMIIVMVVIVIMMADTQGVQTVMHEGEQQQGQDQGGCHTQSPFEPIPLAA